MRDNHFIDELCTIHMELWYETHRRVRMWKFIQETGELLDPEGYYTAHGYSGGNGGKSPEGVNNPEMQNVKNVGPIPRGFYTFGEVVLKSHLGPYAIPLIPDKDNEMFGRSSFYVHGDRVTPPNSASDGCIIMPRDIRIKMYESKDHILEVVA